MGPKSRWEVLAAVRSRYEKAQRVAKTIILTEFCATTGYHRKHALRLLRRDREPTLWAASRRGRPLLYSAAATRALTALWEAAGYPWSVRLRALVPLWLPWARERFGLTKKVEREICAMSPSTIDRRLREVKRRARRRLYGRTKPGTLLKHQIPIQTQAWDTKDPGFGEMDLVSHSGPAAGGEFLHSLNFTDIATAWVETRAVMGKSELRVAEGLSEIAVALPFTLRGLDSDNGSEFINHHLLRFCRQRGIQFTRSRPYKKDDNAHIEQKNWTHVRKVLGWDRYDSDEALAAINDLYRNELSWMMNLFQPSVKLCRKTRVGARVRRTYDAARTPLDRLLDTKQGDAKRIRQLLARRRALDPFALAEIIDQKLARIFALVAQPAAAKQGLWKLPGPAAPWTATERSAAKLRIKRSGGPQLP